MKHLLIIGVAALALATVTIDAQAQTSTNMPPFPSPSNTSSNSVTSFPEFLDNVYTWGTSVDTNKDWQDTSLDIESGYKQITGEGAASYASLDYRLGTARRFNLSAQMEYFGVGSAVNAVYGGLGYAFYQNHDFKLEFNLRFGDDFIKSEFVIAPELSASKLVTKNTYLRLAWGLPIELRGDFQGLGEITFGGGVTF